MWTLKDRETAVKNFQQGYADGTRKATDHDSQAWFEAPNVNCPSDSFWYAEGDGEGCPEREGFDRGYWTTCEFLHNNESTAHRDALKAYPLSDIEEEPCST